MRELSAIDYMAGAETLKQFHCHLAGKCASIMKESDTLSIITLEPQRSRIHVKAPLIKGL